MAVVTKTRSPNTMGLECARPGISVFQATFCDLPASQETGGLAPSATPEACGPRKVGQLGGCGRSREHQGREESTPHFATILLNSLVLPPLSNVNPVTLPSSTLK